MTASSNHHISRFLHTRLPRVCVAVTASDPSELIEKAEALIRDNTFLEFRLDYLAKPALALSKIKDFVEYHPHLFFIATCRRAASGGKFKGSIASQLEILSKCAAVGCQLVDVELETALKCKPQQLQQLRQKSALVLSYHDFRGTKKLEETLAKMAAFPADYYKIVGTATTLYDNVVMMKFLEKHSDKHSLIGLCMGEQGIISRVLGVRAGSVFTFAAVNPDEKTAPGQVTAQELRSTYRIEQIDIATKVYGVAGDPVAQSLSPAIMNAAMRRENVNAVYVALHAKTIKDLLACVREIPIHGLSITMPYKEAIVSHLDNTDSHTTKSGACNTVVRAQDGKLYGFNTDSAGILRPLEQRITIDKAKILVLGAGGAARAAVFGLKERGAEVYILNRSIVPAQKLARSARARLLRRPDLKKHTFDVIINATPVGMGNQRESPLNADEIKAKYVFDMVYDPRETRLLQLAREKGAEIIPGVEMFVHQAARQFEIWTGKPAPWNEMLNVVDRALQDRAAAQNGSAKSAALKVGTKPGTVKGAKTKVS
jgi:3-dehydroquinate dehydratase/shikimate dehydrogenase